MLRQLAKWTGFGICALLGLAILSLVFSPLRDAVWATLFLTDFIAGDDSSLFKTLTPEPEMSSGVLEADGDLQIPFNLYRPPDAKAAAAIVFTHGLAYRGNQDPRIHQQAQRLARAVKTWIDTLSLHHYAPHIKAHLLIVHSSADAKVSFTESLDLARNLPSDRNPG